MAHTPTQEALSFDVNKSAVGWVGEVKNLTNHLPLWRIQANESRLSWESLRTTSTTISRDKTLKVRGKKINPWISACGISHIWLFCDPIDCSLPGFSVPGIFQARILDWVAISYSRGSSWPRDQTLTSWVSYIGRWVLHHCATWEAQNSWIGWVLFAVFRIFFVMLGCCSLNPWEDHLNPGQKNTCWT